MKMYEQLQSTTGSVIAGIGIPTTDTEIQIPFVDMHFDNSVYAAAGAAALGFGIYKTFKHKQKTDDILNADTYTAGSDQKIKARKSIVKGRARGMALGLTATAFLSSALLDKAGPYTSESISKIDSLAVVVDSGYESYAEDVDTGNGEKTTRIQATIDTLNSLTFDGIEVTFIAAGAVPEPMGTITGSDEDARNALVDNFYNYLSSGNEGTEVSGGGDVESALSDTAVQEADVTVVFTGTMNGQEQANVLEGEAVEGNNNVIIVSLGQSGSSVESVLGDQVSAPIEQAYNQTIVGKEDSYNPTSTDELKNVMKGIIQDQIQEDEPQNVKFFDKIRNASALLLGVATYLYFVGPDSRRKTKFNKSK